MIERVIPAAGQESVWDYPRPPRLERCPEHLSVKVGGVMIAESRACLRVLETSHPPVYYFPPEDVRLEHVIPRYKVTWCEWKGATRYHHIKIGGRLIENAAWSYPDPTKPFQMIRNFLAFYSHLMDECTVDGEVVQAQVGNFYGGWITSKIVGPFKGAAGTSGW